MSEELQRTPEITPAELEQIREAPLTVAQVLDQVNLIRTIIKQVMKVGTHYGKLPGTTELCMYKPGAEILGVAFRLTASFKTKITDLENGHRDYRTLCLLHTYSGRFVCDAEGFCSTMEKKYRWRGAPSAYEFTGKGVPKAYWNLKNKGDLGGARAQIGGAGFTAKRNPETNDWEICTMKGGVAVEDRIANPDIADLYNTCLKMAEKRAHVGAILRATGASEMFAVDADDAGNADPATSGEDNPPKDKKPPKGKAQAKNGKPPPFPSRAEGLATPDQIQRIKYLMSQRTVDEETWTRWLDNISKLSTFTAEQMARYIDKIESFPVRRDRPEGVEETPPEENHGDQDTGPAV